MIDLHCHLLPGVDDGSRTVEQSVRVLTTMRESGVTAVCLTPHHTIGHLSRGLPPGHDAAFYALSAAAPVEVTLHRGVELGLGAELLPGLRADLALSHARHTYEAWSPKPGVELGGREIETAPRILLNAALSYAPPALDGGRFGVEWTRVGSYWMDPENTHRYPGHDLLGLRAAVPVTEHLSVFCRLVNVADRRFAESAAYTAARGEEYAPGMPRTLYLGLQRN